jgi:hypothetical protein
MMSVCRCPLRKTGSWAKVMSQPIKWNQVEFQPRVSGPEMSPLGRGCEQKEACSYWAHSFDTIHYNFQKRTTRNRYCAFVLVNRRVDRLFLPATRLSFAAPSPRHHKDQIDADGYRHGLIHVNTHTKESEKKCKRQVRSGQAGGACAHSRHVSRTLRLGAGGVVVASCDSISDPPLFDLPAPVSQ